MVKMWERLTSGMLRRLWKAMPRERSEQMLPGLQQALQNADATTPERAAAFVANLLHESGGFQWMEEIWGPSQQQRRYEPPSTLATRLGNSEKGDGFRYRGRGPIQITGRENYREYGKLLALDLEGSPELAATPEVGFKIAAAYWQTREINKKVDAGDLRGVTKAINGGLNGHKEREALYRRALREFRKGDTDA